MSDWGSKLGCLDSEIQYVGEKVWGCGLGVFDLVGCNGPCQHIGLGHPNVTYCVYPLALGFKGSERGSKLGPVANNDENIAYTAQVRIHDLGHTWVTRLGISLTVYHTTSPGHTKQPGSRSMTHAHYTVGRLQFTANGLGHNIKPEFKFGVLFFFFKIVSSSLSHKLSLKLYQYLQLNGRQLFLKS